MTPATWITVSRLLAVPILLFGLRWTAEDGFLPSDSARWVCLVAFLLAAGTDWLDGYVARRFNQVTDLGKILDPLVDKLLVFAPLLCLVELREIPAWSVFLILLRELTIAGWRVQQTQISGANLWGKAKTVSQITAIALLIAPSTAISHNLGLVAYGIAVSLTLISGGIYLWPGLANRAATEKA
ncbi:CDP-diacylglycerol--glycerol-3-phosphate 3-phosphatidyltransferase [Altericista sp. CCNU0014]|uniref:CDP-diacylglycerol--glycerol-3-phosphate 3-phosphatidyltransferase n=1 Tax=Altericista sp. CCNU0014 TaxID=3082949 RepID=UPI00384ECA1F